MNADERRYSTVFICVDLRSSAAGQFLLRFLNAESLGQIGFVFYNLSAISGQQSAWPPAGPD
jgi:hypothetical protein